MNNTDKLLRAFIEASGFDIKETSHIESIPYKGGFRAGGFIVDYKVTKKKTNNYASGVGCIHSQFGCDTCRKEMSDKINDLARLYK